MAMASVSVVIPSLGDRPDWRSAVASVLDSGRRCGVETEVVLVWQADSAPDVPEGTVVVPAHRVGVSYARNRGAEAATAPLVGYVDDDEVVDAGWVAQVVEVLADADAAFGPIEPMDDVGRPHCHLDPGPPRVFAATTPPWLVGSGGNMVFRADALTAVGGFDLRFGPGGIGRSAEDTEIIWRLLTGGRRVRWAPDMVVHHPTKSDAEILASRHPYGYGAGRVLRRSRSPRLIANYLHAVARANLMATRRREPAARREARAFGRGLIEGLVDRPLWMSPALEREDVPGAIRSALPRGTAAEPLPVSWGARPHYVWRCADAVLHAYIGPTEAQLAAPPARERIVAAAPAARIPAIRAHARGRDALWVLEDRVEGDVPDEARAAEWWPDVAAWIVSYGAVEGPPFGTTDEFDEDAAAWLDAAPPALRGAAEQALMRGAARATGAAHGDLQPKNVVLTPQGPTAVDWEWCTDAALRGMDLLFLAVTHAGLQPDAGVVRDLLHGRNPAFGDVLGPAAALGLEGPVLHDALLVMLIKWAANERRRVAALGAGAHAMPYITMLDELTPLLVERTAGRVAAAG
jgi:GT2 family glycosyltransferase